jgi:hypothetical protein
MSARSLLVAIRFSDLSSGRPCGYCFEERTS